MPWRVMLWASAMAATLAAAAPAARAFDDAKFPDWKGAWDRTVLPRWVQPGDTAPLTAEYQAVYDANLAAQARGEPGDAPQWYCLPQGMPMMMSAFDPMEFVITPDTTYVLISHVNDSYRRIYTDGRDWPREIEPTFAGYSIGEWADADALGHYHTLVVETRGLKSPRTYDATGLPFHKDGQTIIKERIHLDSADRNFLLNDITVIDHALTRPWTVTKRYRRLAAQPPEWRSQVCAEANSYVRIHDEAFFLSADGYLMPIRKDQPPPDLRYFDQLRK
ncbi:MAG TPA: hypothetical protein VKW08_27990 [Xanthobacteraceae bacterium]|nr:hypothetical protein [Xanthobacteraceae bacterium]